MIPHIHTLFEFISTPYEDQHQALNIKKNEPGPNQVSRVFNYATAPLVHFGAAEGISVQKHLMHY